MRGGARAKRRREAGEMGGRHSAPNNEAEESATAAAPAHDAAHASRVDDEAGDHHLAERARRRLDREHQTTRRPPVSPDSEPRNKQRSHWATYALAQLDFVEVREQLNTQETAVVTVDEDEVGQGTVRVTGDIAAHSTICSVSGSTAAYISLAFLIAMIVNRFESHEPTINEVIMESANPSLRVPDIAFTYNLDPDDLSTFGISSSDDLLDYIWPQFRFKTYTDMFSVPTRKFLTESMYAADGVKLGGETGSCGIEAVAGNTWPAFCLRGGDRELTGRFGDAVFAFLEIHLYRCNQTSEDNMRLNSPFDTRWSGRCASDANITAFLDTGTAFNVWFRFSRELWDNHQSPQPPKGEGSGDWTWYDYSELIDGLELRLKLSVQYNKAKVHEPTDPWLGTKTYEWFSYDKTDNKEHRANPDPGDPLADIEVRLSPYPVSRSITVSYMNWQEVVSEIGASYPAALAVGLFLAVVLKTIHSRVSAYAASSDTATSDAATLTQLIHKLKTPLSAPTNTYVLTNAMLESDEQEPDETALALASQETVDAFDELCVDKSKGKST